MVQDTNKKPVEYANVGIPGKGVGTVSDINGRFELVVPAELKNADLKISHIGFGDSIIRISSISNPGNLQILLQPTFTELPEVSFVSRQRTILGYKPSGKKVKGFFTASGLGGEAGTLIRNNESTRLTKFHFNILSFTYDTMLFRLNFYISGWNNPGEKINTSDIIFEITEGDTGIFSVPLTEDITVKDDFFCTIELLEIRGDENSGAEFTYSAIPHKKGRLILRPLSFDRWRKTKNYSLCFWFSGEK